VDNTTTSELECGLYTNRLVMHNLTKMEAKHKCMKNSDLLTNKKMDPASTNHKRRMRLADSEMLYDVKCKPVLVRPEIQPRHEDLCYENHQWCKSCTSSTTLSRSGSSCHPPVG
jgi:hypothetical protein